MAELILELGCEDLPARFVEPALKDIKAAFEAALKEHRLSAEGIRVIGTPRRLVLLVDDLVEKQEDLEEERTGPPVRAAYRDGEPTKAAQGFARGQGVALDDLYVVETPKGEYIAAKVFEAGQATAELLPNLLFGVLESLSFAKSMRWGARRKNFARPVRWLVAKFAGEVVSLDFAGVTSQGHTYGHRFAAPDAIEVQDIAQYQASLEEAFVIVDQASRRQMITSALSALEAEHQMKIVEDPALVDEVVHLVEKPHAVVVTFDASYLELPDEVLISSMRSHQRYFSAMDPATNKLTNKCVVIYNTPVRDPDVVRAGNLRVLKARLDDAKFFWNQDLKRPLSARIDDLESVLWLAKLGDLKARSARIARLSHEVAQLLELDDDAIHAARRAGQLSKTDLVTLMVDEFPDLQGVMGGAYAALTGEDDAVALAIKEHYLPSGADDPIPSSDVGACVALAERLDTLVGIFGIGLIPKSSADPYGLRRAALGVLRILQGRGYSLSLLQLLRLSFDVYQRQGKTEAFVAQDADASIAVVFDFMTTRLKHLLMADYPTDVVDAVLNVAADEVLAARDRVDALAHLRHEPDFEPLAIGFKRVVNILNKQAQAVDIPEVVDPARLAQDQERALFDAANAAQTQVLAALEVRDWTTACKALIGLKQPIDDFFDHVMVMADDEALRLNRLALLNQLRVLFLGVANISMIQVEL